MGRPRSIRSVYLSVGLYLAMLVVAPFEHHDLSCELKTPQHCTSCSSTQLGADTHVLLAPDAAQLADAGRATAFVVLNEGTLVVVQSTGRSPPTAL